MPWKLLLFILLLVLVMLFVGYNLDNRTDISVIFHTFEDVPVFFSMFGAFLLGVLVALPVALSAPFIKKKKLSKKKGNDNKTRSEQPSYE